MRTLLKGRVVFNNRFSLIECIVRDLSGTGARIAFAHPIDVPREFELEIPSKSLSLWSRVIWSSGREHGVRFDIASLNPAEPPAQQAVETRIETILDEARRRIAREMDVPVAAINLTIAIVPK